MYPKGTSCGAPAVLQHRIEQIRPKSMRLKMKSYFYANPYVVKDPRILDNGSQNSRPY